MAAATPVAPIGIRQGRGHQGSAPPNPREPRPSRPVVLPVAAWSATAIPPTRLGDHVRRRPVTAPRPGASRASGTWCTIRRRPDRRGARPTGGAAVPASDPVHELRQQWIKLPVRIGSIAHRRLLPGSAIQSARSWRIRCSDTFSEPTGRPSSPASRVGPSGHRLRNDGR